MHADGPCTHTDGFVGCSLQENPDVEGKSVLPYATEDPDECAVGLFWLVCNLGQCMKSAQTF